MGIRLKTKATKSQGSFPFCKGNPGLVVGDDVYFSGFPFGVSAMLTHKGMLSGFTENQSVLCIQAPINKGNSGGALLNARGEVIGIISSREGGIPQALDQIRKTIGAMGSQNVISVKTNNITVDFLQVDKEVINVLDRYISTGIGYARNISSAREYVRRHGLMKSESSAK